MLLPVGTHAPDFSLASPDGRPVRLSYYIHLKTVVIYFYPKDDTPGCTIEACGFRDAYEEFVSAGAEVIGISSDPVAAHQSFRARYRLPFVLASDVDGSTARAYGVSKRLGGLKARATFVIDRHGVVRDAFSSILHIKKHVTRSLRVIRSIR